MFRLPKICSAVLLAGAVLLHCPSYAQEVLNGIAAVVGVGGKEEVITFSEVRELVGAKERQARETLKGEQLVEKIKEIRLAAINDLIDRALILQEFKTKGYMLPAYVVDERIATIIRDEFGGDRQAFLRTLAAQGFTLEKFKEFQRNTIIVGEMRRSATKGATAVSDAKIGEYYKEHAEEYSSQEEIHLRMIVIRGSGDSEGRKKMMEEIRQRVVEGAEFGSLARMYDQGGQQESEGDLGWINRKYLNESLTKVAFSLKPGEVSQIAELGGSYYLMYCEAKKAATTKPLKDVRDEIEKNLTQVDRQKQQQEWIQKLRKKAYIKMY